jgi:hypothetical protein
MIYEIRLYTIVPGRFDVAFDRFEKHLPQLFDRHGIRNAGRWQATAGPGGPMFIYLLAYNDLAEREEQWTAFYQDQEWSEVRSDTQGAEEATERFDLFFLRHNGLWTPRADRRHMTETGVQELVFAELALGKATPAYDYLKTVYFPAVEKAGGRIMMVTDFLSGPSMPRMAWMIGWDDANHRDLGWMQIHSDHAVHDAIASQRIAFGRALLGASDTYSLQPTTFDYPLATLANPLSALD